MNTERLRASGVTCTTGHSTGMHKKRVEEVLAESFRHVRSVGDAAALQQVVNQMANDNSKRKKRKK